MKKIKIATWNIGSLYDGKKARMSVLKKTLKRHSPDIFAVQECPNEEWLCKKILKYMGGMAYKFVECSESHVALGKKMGIAIFSKYPLSAPEILHLDELSVTEYTRNGKRERLHRKYFMCCEITVDGEKIKLITGHGYPVHRYQIPEEIFTPSFTQISEWANQMQRNISAENLFFACDFNVPHALDYMPNFQEEFIDPFSYIATRPSGRKTDAVIAHKQKVFYELTSAYTGFDHNFIIVTVE